MTAGPLHPDNIPAGRDRSLGKGHGTESLGPSDSSDSGSDLKGAPGLAQQVDGFGLEHGPVNDLEESFAGNTAGPDVGDANLDSDTDRGGTGERASSARDTVVPDGIDIDTDRIESIPDLEQGIDPDEEDEEGAPRRRRH
jgi:hypothetical protein